MNALHETEVDGVRCFYVETGRPTLAAVLTFRFGMADEPLTESGFQHLLEHLALDGHHAGGSLDTNGHTTLLHTGFDAHGPADLVARHLSAVTAWLSQPRFPDLGHERRVLRAETELRGRGPTARALAWRYGAQGPGTASYLEPGLTRASAERLGERAAKVFTRGNAVLALDGPPPPGLRLHLPDGELIRPAPARPVEDRYPGMYVEPTGLVLSGVVPRSTAATLAAEQLKRTLAEKFRHQLGAAYAPWSSYEPVDDDHAVLFGGSDIQGETLDLLADQALVLGERLSREFLDRTSLESMQEAAIQARMDPYAQFGVAVAAAHEVLRGRPPRSLDEALDDIADVSRVELRDTFESWHRQLLVGVPGQTRWRDQVPALSAPTNPPQVRGRRWKAVNWPADPARLVVAPDAVELAVGREARTIPIRDVVAVFSHENGVRSVVPADGYSLTINPHEWRGGRAAVGQPDRGVAAEVQLPHPAVEGLRPVRRLSLLRRVWRRWGPRGSAAFYAKMLAPGFLIIAGVALILLDLGRRS